MWLINTHVSCACKQIGLLIVTYHPDDGTAKCTNKIRIFCRINKKQPALLLCRLLFVLVTCQESDQPPRYLVSSSASVVGCRKRAGILSSPRNSLDHACLRVHDISFSQPAHVEKSTPCMLVICSRKVCSYPISSPNGCNSCQMRGDAEN
jgi:hypothetical protein